MIADSIKVGNLIGGFSLAIDLAEKKPFWHAHKVSYILMKMADSIGLDPASKNALFYAGLLHDITITSANGLCPICETIEEYKIQLLPELSEADRAIHLASECWDGSGPRGLSQECIPITARLVKLALAIDGVIYNSLDFWRWRESVQEVIRRGRYIEYDPTLQEVVKELITDYTFCLNVSSPNIHQVLEPYTPDCSISGGSELVKVLGVSFSRFIDQKTSFTATHSQDVANVMMVLGKVFNLSAKDRDELYLAALLHDLGKIAVPNSILEKNGPLTKQEFEVIKNHPYYSSLIIDQIPELREIGVIVSQHHERLDGSGYFLGLKGEAISFKGRLLAIADIYSSLVVNRPYRKALTLDYVKDTMYGMAKSGHIDGHILDALLSSV